MRSGWTLYGLPMDAREQAGKLPGFFYAACFPPKRVPVRVPKGVEGH